MGDTTRAAGFRIPGSGFRVAGFGFRVPGFGFWVTGFRFRVPGSVLRISGSVFGVSDTKCRVDLKLRSVCVSSSKVAHAINAAVSSSMVTEFEF